MAKLYPPYIEGTLPAFCLNTGESFDDGKLYSKGDLVYQNNDDELYLYECLVDSLALEKYQQNNGVFPSLDNAAYWKKTSVKAGDGIMAIPFALNKAVSQSEISGLAVKIKSVQNDVLLGSVTIEQNDGEWDFNEDGDGYVNFNVKKFKIIDNDKGIFIKEGMHYKVQLAFIDKKGIVGYYSTVGVIKCTSKPSVFIQDFSDERGAVNNNRTDFVGQFIQAKNGDVTEKVYSSKFTITDLQGNVVYTTGDVLHNTENNPNSYSSQDYMTFNRDLNYGEIYRIQYEVTTTNGLVVKSPNYLLTQQKSLTMEMQGDLIAELNYDEGYIDIQIKGHVDENSGAEEIVTGAFILTREDSLKPGFWEELTRFSINHEAPSKTIFRDFTIEQGKSYTYSLQQFNQHGVFSYRKKSNIIRADFEDMFLYDGERQLKLKFNPQVTSFKTQLSETRSETIGNKYPFFFRNARVGYKVFPVSGLLSMYSDENQFFISYEDILKEDFDHERHNKKFEKNEENYSHRNLIKENFVSERLFKLSALDWLNNGKVKLFRSPGEGNYLVRMMDTSMSPNPTVGRMLHTINSTAYECAECSHNNMVKYNIIKDTSATQMAAKVTNWREEALAKEENSRFDMNINQGLASDNLLKSDDESQYTTILRFIDLLPGTQIKLIFSPDGSYQSENAMLITIGSTGNYYADDIQPVYGIYLVNPQIPDETKPETLLFPSQSGIISYQYETSGRNEFDSISKMEANVGAYKQFVGTVKDLISSLTYTREQPTKICMSNYVKRPIEYLYYAGGNSKFTTSNKNVFTDPSNAKGQRQNAINNLYWDLEFTPVEAFDDESSMEYSPFSLYIVRDMIIDNQSIAAHKPSGYPDDIELDDLIKHLEELDNLNNNLNMRLEGLDEDALIDNGLKEEILSFNNLLSSWVINPFALKEEDGDWNKTTYKDQRGREFSKITLSSTGREKAERRCEEHASSHMFEKYYIDRIIKAVSPEDMLTAYNLAYKKVSEETSETGTLKEWLQDNPLYVIDAWTGEIGKVGVNYLYSSSIIYNGEEIDLREINRYSLDNLEAEDSQIAVGNGVYGDIFYQKITVEYSFETTDKKTKASKAAWLSLNTEIRGNKNRANYSSNEYNQKLLQEQSLYEIYNDDLAAAIVEWTERIE